MRIEQFLYLKKIAETQSMNIACKSLFITQQALSRSIISLEEELGVPLLNRNKHGVSLTIQGEYVLKEGTKILNLADNIRNHFLVEKIAEETSLSIATTPLVNQFVLSTAITYFYKNFPTIGINIEVLSNEDIINHVVNNTIDIGFITEFSFNNYSNLLLPHNLKYIPVFSSTINVLISRNSILNKHKTISIDDLHNMNIIFFKDTFCQNDMLQLFFKGAAMPEVITVDNETLFFKMIADDIGFSFYFNTNELNINLRPNSEVIIRPLSDYASLSLGYIINTEYFNDNIFANIFCEHLL